MKIAFVNFTPILYDIDTPYIKPLGGSESALCYLSEQLAALGHEVIIFTKIKTKKVSRGVVCLPLERITSPIVGTLDILVVQNSPLQGYQIKPFLGEKCKLILWSQHAFDQPAVESLYQEEVRNSFDAVVLISRWQLDSYIKVFSLKRQKCIIHKNAISPAFQNLFKNTKDLLAHKSIPSILAYSSTPFRGLNLLVEMFPFIRREVPNITLRVFSSMKVYQVSEKEDQKLNGGLYQRCRAIEGVEYVGSLSQTQLAKELSSVALFSYPNTFAETSCISVMEAMASGSMVITSDLGALPETTAGFGKLIPVTGNWQEYGRDFIQKNVTFMQKFSKPKERQIIGKRLFAQVEYANKNYNWATRAKEWEAWLTKLTNIKINK